MTSFSASGTESVCVVGLGQVGLTNAAILANRGYRVLGVDASELIADGVNRGEIEICEPNLGALIRKVVAAGRLSASIRPHSADVFMICVPTSFGENDKFDLSPVVAAAQAIKAHVRRGNLIILTSTCSPRTTAESIIAHAVPNEFVIGQDVHVAYCPERALRGHMLVEAVENDRVVGGVTPQCTQIAKAFYETFVSGSVCPTDATTAELVKLTENAFYDVNVALANETFMIADSLGVDPFEVIQLANRHPRVSMLTPRLKSGHQSASDVASKRENSGCASLISTAHKVNDRWPTFVTSQVRKLTSLRRGQTIGCLGLSCEADMNDFRGSASVEVVRQLQAQEFGRVIACDPYARDKQFPDIQLATLDDVLNQSDIVVLLTGHQMFCDLTSEDLRGKQFVDPCGIWRSRHGPGAAPPSTARKIHAA